MIYLGQATPFAALTEVTKKWHSDILVIGALSEFPIYEPEEYLDNLSTTLKSQKILVSGTLAENPLSKSIRIFIRSDQ